MPITSGIIISWDDNVDHHDFKVYAINEVSFINGWFSVNAIEVLTQLVTFASKFAPDNSQYIMVLIQRKSNFVHTYVYINKISGISNLFYVTQLLYTDIVMFIMKWKFSLQGENAAIC
jgi:hypothetical protein